MSTSAKQEAPSQHGGNSGVRHRFTLTVDVVLADAEDARVLEHEAVHVGTVNSDKSASQSKTRERAVPTYAMSTLRQ